MRGDGHTRLGVLAAVFLSFALGAVNVRAVESGHIGPLSFDPHGADFTAWINHFKTQVYKHWPPEEQIGSYGHVVMEFTVARDGALQRVRVKKATGDKALRKAAQDALRFSTFLPLPPDYKLKDVTMRLEFYLDEKPPATSSKRGPA